MHFSDVGNNDYSVIRELLKEIAETAQLDSSKQRAFKGMSSSNPLVHILLAERLFHFRLRTRLHYVLWL
jgi:hypothetical protein